MAMIIILSASVILLIILSGIFSASDMVYAVVNQLRLKKDVEKGSKVSKLALKYAKDYDTTITTILFSNNLVNIAALNAVCNIKNRFDCNFLSETVHFHVIWCRKNTFFPTILHVSSKKCYICSGSLVVFVPLYISN